MGRKRLGVLMAQADESTQRSFLQGFMQKAYALDYDVCVFSMVKKGQETIGRDIGDASIFDLVNYDTLDGIVYYKDVILNKALKAAKLEETIQERFNGPVITLGRESENFMSLCIDHRTGMRKIVDHLIEVHGYKDIVFLNGKKGHPHSIMRYNGYVDSMTSHGLPVLEENVFDGDYWYTSGGDMVDELLKRGSGLPDAIACANDYMAIGVCDRLADYGYSVPKDVAVTGYDSNAEGQTSPSPITSAVIPAEECGLYAAESLDAMINGRTPEPFKGETVMFPGKSCGCDTEEPAKPNHREEWGSDDSRMGYMSSHNHIMDDLIAQHDEKDFFYMVFDYIHQIRDFESFSLCFNENWRIYDGLTADNENNQSFTKKMNRIIRCGRCDADTSNIVSFDETFSRDILIPEFENADRHNGGPTTYFFVPIFFDNRVFGYAAISYGDEIHSYDRVFKLWIRSVSQCYEAFRRQNAFKLLIEKMEATQIRDSLTGMYNYRGFLKRSRDLEDMGRLKGRNIVVTAVDLNRLKEINAGYGRDEGDEAICNLGSIIEDVVVRGEIAARMGNDEFIIASVVADQLSGHGEDLIEAIKSYVASYNETSGKPYKLEVCCGTLTRMISDVESLEHLVNDSVSLKNGIKQEMMRVRQENRSLSPEDIENDGLVKDILDNNRFTYHFQPIVNARTGEIFAYEALMRADIEKKLSPPVILQSAERMGRLYDIERATFFNVVNYIKEHGEQFEGKKVFINSIPGSQLTGDDRTAINRILSSYGGKVVVEFTEETEINDEQLEKLKYNFEEMKIETAIDDYGAGYSNVNNLLRYMPRYVKIDRMLITEIQDNPQKQHFVRDIIEFAHDNDVLALAEGVETTKELKEAIKLGVDLIQGYYTAKPAAIPIDNIPTSIMAEIIQYSQSNQIRTGKKEFKVGDSRRISIIQLAMNKYSDIIVPGVELSDETNLDIIGGSGFESNIVMRLEDGFKGNIVLDNVSFAGEKGSPCIALGDNCDVTMTLVGDNKLRTGGIKVPESSSLTINGDGNLYININNGRFYAIGNDYNSTHGKLVFDQDGFIYINANGMKGIGIGSGLGGDIFIRRGGYDFEINGQDGVAIGAVDADAHIDIRECDMSIKFGIAKGVIVGSVNRNADIFFENVSSRLRASSNTIAGVGSLYGDTVKITFSNGNYNLNLMGTNECYAIGGSVAKTDFEMKFARTFVDVQGKKTLAIGDSENKSSAYLFNSSMDSNVVNNNNMDMGMLPENFRIVNGNSTFILNNEIIFREIEVGEL